MAKKLSEIQTGVRFSSRDGAIVLTTEANLAMVNRIYRSLASSLPWSELRREDTSISTTAGTEIYTWPNSNIFLDVTNIEMQDEEDQNRYKMVHTVLDEFTWNQSGNKINQSIPDHYNRDSDGTISRIRFRPLPKYSGKTVRITGIIEPKSLVNAGNETVFLQRAADDALEHLISADIADKKGFLPHGQAQLSKATNILRNIFGKELVPVELTREIIQT